MNYIKRAVIMAAGMGKRMNPVTEKIPKPLIRVNGIRMIDTAIQGFIANGIQEIYVVTGYLKDQFYCLETEYKGVKIIENPYYERCNNISSLYMAREYLKDAIILDGDQIIYNKDVLSPEFEHSGYNAVWVENGTDEWLMTVENDIVIDCSRSGGKTGWQLFGISRWNAEDGQKLKKHLEEEFEVKKNRQIYWDDIVMFLHKEEYRLGIFPMLQGDVVEIDNLCELAAIDNSYQAYANRPGEEGT